MSAPQFEYLLLAEDAVPGDLHFENGEWIIGDVRVNQMLADMVGDSGNRVSGALVLEWYQTRSRRTGMSFGNGARLERSEPAKTSKT